MFSMRITFLMRMNSIISPLKMAHAAPDKPEQHGMRMETGRL
ncbi:hypothetical protein FHS19_006614 [Paenibacillus rhizosphaerae]|uniref:Uncharacterized protein n=1 Tax=Paenibacillus rhizosphaerae TaxID=297318 RepID=A0A839U2K3_9BACL|nr:hypothetical protein [Paenibacillus rhizosphaerae]